MSTISSLYLATNLKLDLMNKASALLLKYNDYRSFCITPEEHNTTICYVTEARWLSDSSGDNLRFHISANRFLSRMIRIIVGKILQVGNGKLSLDEFESYLNATHKPKHLSPAYPQGLYLSKVTYPYLDIPTRSTIAGILTNDQRNWQHL